MSKQHYAHIRSNTRFKELALQRSRLSWTLAILIMVVYYSFILVIAFAPELFGIPLGDTTIITWGLLTGIGVILFTFLVTGIYVYRANNFYDKLMREVVDASEDHVKNANNNNRQGAWQDE